MKADIDIGEINTIITADHDDDINKYPTIGHAKIDGKDYILKKVNSYNSRYIKKVKKAYQLQNNKWTDADEKNVNKFIKKNTDNKMYAIDHYIKAQKRDYDTALNEFKVGYKSGHYIWYIFPQIKELVEYYTNNKHKSTSTNKRYSFQNLNHAIAYLEDKLLRDRLLETTKQLCAWIPSKKLLNIVGADNVKVISSFTIFIFASYETGDKEIFDHMKKCLIEINGGELDEGTRSKVPKYQYIRDINDLKL